MKDVRVEKAHEGCIRITLRNPTEMMLFSSNLGDKGYFTITLDDTSALLVAENVLNYLSEIEGGIHEKHQDHHEATKATGKTKRLAILPPEVNS